MSLISAAYFSVPMIDQTNRNINNYRFAGGQSQPITTVRDAQALFRMGKAVSFLVGSFVKRHERRPQCLFDHSRRDRPALRLQYISTLRMFRISLARRCTALWDEVHFLSTDAQQLQFEGTQLQIVLQTMY